MATYGVDFRSSSGYVTDPSGFTYCTGEADQYPTTRGGLTFGYTVNPFGDLGRDRDSGLDARLAGVNQFTNGDGVYKWQLDLPSTGSKDIGIAIGDATQDQAYFLIEAYENDSTLIFSLTGSVTAANFIDASGVSRTAAAWSGSNVIVNHTFSTTVLTLRCGTAAAESGNTPLACVYVTDASAPAVAKSSTMLMMGVG